MLHFAKREFESILYATVRLFCPLDPYLSIQRSSIFARDHASKEYFQKVSPLLLRVARRLMPVQLPPLPYSLRYSPRYFSRSLLISPSTGLFLAYPIYGPTYAANSPYVRGTFRSNPQFLWICASTWLVRAVSRIKSCTSRP